MLFAKGEKYESPIKFSVFFTYQFGNENRRGKDTIEPYYQYLLFFVEKQFLINQSHEFVKKKPIQKTQEKTVNKNLKHITFLKLCPILLSPPFKSVHKTKKDYN